MGYFGFAVFGLLLKIYLLVIVRSLVNEMCPIVEKHSNSTLTNGAESPGLPTIGTSWIIVAKIIAEHGSTNTSQPFS